MKTFYYKTNTYLFPEGKSLVQFQEEVKTNPYTAVQLLREDHCLAPYFIKEDIQNILLRIDDPSRIIETEGCVLSRSEYEKYLRENVIRKCPGCVRYGNDPEDLSGHDTEMVLDGLCLQRKEVSEYSLKAGTTMFWKKFLNIEKKVRALMKRGETDQALALIQNIYSQHIGAGGSMFLRICSGRSILIMSAQSDAMVQNVLEYVVNMAPEELFEKWDIYNYMPAKIYEYKPEGSYDPRLYPPRIHYEKRETDHTRFDLTFVIRKNDDPKVSVNLENYRYICSLIGENLLNSVMLSFRFTFECDEETVSVEEFLKKIKSTYPNSETERYSAETNLFSYQFTPNIGSVMRGGRQQSVTSCSELTFKVALYDNKEQVEAYLNHLNLLCGILETELTNDDTANRRMMNIMFQDIIPDLTKQRLVHMFGYEVSEDRLYIDMLIMDVGLLRQQIRKHAPELASFGCLYTEINKDERVTIKVDYDMKQIEQGKDPKLS